MIRNLFVFAIAAVFFLVPESEAQWAQMGGPYGGSVTQLIASGNNLFAGTDNGVYLSTDTGSSWKPVNKGLPDDKRVFALVKNDSSLFAAISSYGIYRSSVNDTCNWKLIRSASGDYVYSLAAEKSTILAGMSSGKVLISTDNGENWSVKDSSLSNFPIYSLAIRDSLIIAGTSVDLFISYDNGTIWKSIDKTDVNGMYCIRINDSVIYVANRYGWVFRSIDNGSNWIKVTNGLENARVETFTVEGDTVYGGSCSYSQGGIPGVFESTDKGETWTPLDSASTNKNVLSLVLSGDRIIAGTEDDGIFLNRKGQNGWVQAGRGLYPAISCLLVMNCELFAGTEHGLFLSSDGCKTWTKADFIKPNLKIVALARSNNSILAGTNTDGIYCSDDNGTTWRKTKAFDSTLCLTVNDSFIIAGNTRGIQQCRVDDSVWTWVDKKFPSYGILSIAAHDSMVFAGGYFSGAFRSTDYGKTWNSIDTTDFPASLTSSFAICGDTVFASMLLGGVYRSADKGVNWTKLEGLASRGYGDIGMVDSTVIVSTFENIYYTTDFGSTWYPAGSGLENKSVYSLFTAGNDLYAGTELDGIWHRSVSELLTPVIEGKKQRALSQRRDFKIRFNGSENSPAVIEFTLPGPMLVKVRLYDIAGREIISPVNGYFGAGTHTVKWNTREIASGFYIAKMYAGDLHAADIVKVK